MSTVKQSSFQCYAKQWRQGEERAFNELATMAYGRITAAARAMLAKRRDLARFMDAQDLVHDVYSALKRQRNREFENLDHFVNRARVLMRGALSDLNKRMQAHKRLVEGAMLSLSTLNTDC